MIERTLEGVLDDSPWLDIRYLFRRGAEFKEDEDQAIFDSFKKFSDEGKGKRATAEDVWKIYQDFFSSARRMIQNHAIPVSDTIRTWSECESECYKIFTQRKFDSLYDQCHITDIKKELGECSVQIKVALLYLAIDYLYRNERAEKKYGKTYVKDVLCSSLPNSLGYAVYSSEDLEDKFEYTDEIRSFFHSLSKLSGIQEDYDETINKGSIKKAISDSCKKIYDRTKKDAGKGTEAVSINKRYEGISGFSANPYVIQQQPHLYYHELIDYIKRVIDTEDSGVKVLSFISVLPLLIFETGKELPAGPYTQNGSLTYERLLDICHKVEAYRAFPALIISDSCTSSKEDAYKIRQILYDWSCEDAFHIDRLDLAIQMVLEAFESLDWTDKDREKKERKIIKLFSLMIQIPYSYCSIIDTFQRVAISIANGNEIPQEDISYLFCVSSVIYPSYLTLCAQLLFTDKNGEIKNREDIEIIIRDLIKEVIRSKPVTGNGMQWSISELPEDILEHGETTYDINKYFKVKFQKKNRDYDAKPFVYIKERYTTDLTFSDITNELIRQNGNLSNYLSFMYCHRMYRSFMHNNLVTHTEIPQPKLFTAEDVVDQLKQTFLKDLDYQKG